MVRKCGGNGTAGKQKWVRPRDGHRFFFTEFLCWQLRVTHVMLGQGYWLSLRGPQISPIDHIAEYFLHGACAFFASRVK